MKKIPLISVIMPCYNASATLSLAIKSVLSQTFKDFQLICIDDKSTDDTLLLLEKFAKLDARVLIVRNDTNLGLGLTRNVGITRASGKYLAFIDSDDAYEVDFLESLHEALLNTDADIAQCCIRYVFDSKSFSYGSPQGLIQGEHCKYRIDLFDGLPYVSPQAWNKLYKRSIFHGEGYKTILYEDAEILPNLLTKVNKIVCISEPLYNYNKRFAVLTGEQKRNLKQIAFGYESLFLSMMPYNGFKFIALSYKWGGTPAGTPVANIKNYLGILTSGKKKYHRDELEQIYEMTVAFSMRLFEASADIYKARLREVFEHFFTQMGLRKRAARDLKKLGFFQKQGSLFSVVGVYLLEQCLGYLDFFIPKKKNVWLFTSWGRYNAHTLDNPRALFEHVKENTAIKKIVLLNSKRVDRSLDSGRSDIKFYPARSFRGLWSLLTAGYVFAAYSLNSLFGYRRLRTLADRKIILLWHGIPIKKVGLQVSRGLEPWWPKEVTRYFSTIASSEEDKKIMQDSFFPHAPQSVKLAGLPRHDFLAKKDAELPDDYIRYTKVLRERVNNRMLFLFVPTWRYGNEKPCMFTQQELERLDILLRENNATVAIKLHPNMMGKDKRYISFVSNNIFLVNDFPDANILLREADALITDYSSLYLDFIKLQRPILLYTPDAVSYKNHRGFNYRLAEFLPHNYVIEDFDTLVNKMKTIIAGEYQRDAAYYEVMTRFHSFPLDTLNSDRVIAAMPFFPQNEL